MCIYICICECLFVYWYMFLIYTYIYTYWRKIDRHIFSCVSMKPLVYILLTIYHNFFHVGFIPIVSLWYPRWYGNFNLNKSLEWKYVWKSHVLSTPGWLYKCVGREREKYIYMWIHICIYMYTCLYIYIEVYTRHTKS